MKKEFEKVTKKFPKLKLEEVEQKFLFDEELEIHHHLNINGLQGNPDLTILIRAEDEIKTVLEIPLEDIFVFKDFLGIYYDKKVEVILTDIGFRSFLNEKRLEKSQ